MSESPPASTRFPRRTFIVALLAAALGVAAGLFFFRSSPEATRDAAPLLGLSLPDPDGKLQPLEQWRGKLLVVNFWATWCAPCREEMPMFVRAQSAHGAKGLQFVGIAVDEAPKVKAFAAEIGLNYPTLVGGYGAMELSKVLGNTVMALPFTVVVDQEGRVLQTRLGPVKQAELDRLIETAL